MSFILGVLSFLGNLFSFFTRKQEETIGQDKQKLSDSGAALKAVARERDALAGSDDAEDAAKAGKF